MEPLIIAFRSPILISGSSDQTLLFAGSIDVDLPSFLFGLKVSQAQVPMVFFRLKTICRTYLVPERIIYSWSSLAIGSQSRPEMDTDMKKI
jgi:hypothetical protein